MTINLPLPYDRSRLRRNAILSRIKFGAWGSKPLPQLVIRDELDECIRRATPKWSGIDADAWLRDIRGDVAT